MIYETVKTNIKFIYFLHNLSYYFLVHIYLYFVL